MKTLLIATALAGVSFGAAAQTRVQHHTIPAEAFYATTVGQPEQRLAPPQAPPQPREDFGSFSTGSVARNLGY